MTVSLKALLGAAPVRSSVVADCVSLVEAQVRSKSGISGVAIKGAYGAIKRIKPNVVPEVIDGMLDDWLDQMQPYYDEWSTNKDGSFAAFLTGRSSDVAEALLTVTDRRAERSKHRTAKKAYERMRGSAKSNVVEAIPDLGALVERHLDDAASGDLASDDAASPDSPAS